MSTVVSIIAFIIIIGLVIFIHEFGHYLAAKRNGVGVVEFAIGMGPDIFSWVKNGTKYSVKWIPFGGYCMMLGQENYLPDPDAEGEEIVMDEEHAFKNKTVWQRIAVIAAGPIFNFILAILLAVLLTAMIGATTSKIGAVADGYPAAEAGLQAGDEIVKLNKTRIHLFSDITMYFTVHEGETVDVTYKRNGERYTVTLVPEYIEDEGRYKIGIISSQRETGLSFFETVKYGYYEFAYNASAVFKSLGMLFSGKASFNDLSGPVGMGKIVNEIVDEVQEDTKDEGFWTTAYWTLVNLISFTVLISANLGVMNLLPIPAVDGGRLLFLLIELVIGKPVPKKFEGVVTVAGFILLALLMIAVLFNDVRKLFI